MSRLTYQRYMAEFRRMVSTIIPGANLPDQDVLATISRLRQLDPAFVAVNLPDEFDNWLHGHVSAAEETFSLPPAPIVPRHELEPEPEPEPEPEQVWPQHMANENDDDEDEEEEEDEDEDEEEEDLPLPSPVVANAPQKKKKGPGGLTPPLQRPNESDEAYQQRLSAWNVQAANRVKRHEAKKERKRKRKRATQKEKRQAKETSGKSA